MKLKPPDPTRPDQIAMHTNFTTYIEIFSRPFSFKILCLFVMHISNFILF